MFLLRSECGGRIVKKVVGCCYYILRESFLMVVLLFELIGIRHFFAVHHKIKYLLSYDKHYIYTEMK